MEPSKHHYTAESFGPYEVPGLAGYMPQYDVGVQYHVPVVEHSIEHALPGEYAYQGPRHVETYSDVEWPYYDSNMLKRHASVPHPATSAGAEDGHREEMYLADRDHNDYSR